MLLMYLVYIHNYMAPTSHLHPKLWLCQAQYTPCLVPQISIEINLVALVKLSADGNTCPFSFQLEMEDDDTIEVFRERIGGH